MEIFRVKGGFLACHSDGDEVLVAFDGYDLDYGMHASLDYGLTACGGLRKPVAKFPDVGPHGYYTRVDKNHVVFNGQVHFCYDSGKREMHISCGAESVKVKYETKEQKYNDETPGPSVVFDVVLRQENNPFDDLSWVLQVGRTSLSYPARMQVKVAANRIEEFLALADNRWVEVSRRHD